MGARPYSLSMSEGAPRRRSPELELAGVERLLIDGNNILHRIAGSPDEAAQRQLIARLRAILPVTVATTLVLDGAPDRGAPLNVKVTGSLDVRHAGPAGADHLIVSLVEGRPFAARARTLIVTDDRALGDRIRTAGAGVRRLGWLQGMLSAAEGPRAPGSRLGAGGAPARTPAPAAPDRADADSDAAPWRPGRGATRKRGNPRRGRS